jgi:hypothetical protein
MNLHKLNEIRWIYVNYKYENKIKYIFDASAYYDPGAGGSQFEGDPLPISRLGSSWLNYKYEFFPST